MWVSKRSARASRYERRQPAVTVEYLLASGSRHGQLTDVQLLKFPTKRPVVMLMSLEEKKRKKKGAHPAPMDQPGWLTRCGLGQPALWPL